MAIVYVTTGAWGVGAGAPLTAAQVDGNFYTLAQQIVDILAAPSDAVGITNITVVGSQMMIFLSDATELGPFTLPTAKFQYRGEWQPATEYFELDVITVADMGVYIVQVPHVSDATFDEAAIDPDTTEALYFKSFGAAAPAGSGVASDAYPAVEHKMFGGI